MPVYYFIIKHGSEVIKPPSGLRLPDIRAAWEEATTATGEILRDLDGSLEVGTEWSIQIQDETGKPLRTIKLVSEANE
jgi:hypothetical protein